MDYEDLKAITADKIDEYLVKPCDLFTKCLSYWELVLEVNLNSIIIIDSDEWSIKEYTKKEWQKRCSYEDTGGHWITYVPTDDDMVKKFFESYYDHISNNPRKVSQILLENYPQVWEVIKNEEFII